MNRQKNLWMVLSLLPVAVLILVAVLTAAENTATSSKDSSASESQPGSRRGGMQERGNFQERMKAMLKQELGASDEEWKVIEPRLTKAMTLSRDTNLRPMRGMMGMGPGMTPPMPPAMESGKEPRGPRPEAERSSSDTEKSEVQKAADTLQKALEKETPDAEEIKTSLAAYREAREKARQELAKAQQELREILTVDQEAKLVLAGLID